MAIKPKDIADPQEIINNIDDGGCGQIDMNSGNINAILPSNMTEDESRTWAECDGLRTSFTLAMSAMCKEEVPLYSDLVRIVSSANTASMANGDLDPKVLAMRFGDVSPSRLDVERHGAIRLGTAEELQTIRRVFAVLGLFPVGYYDLSEAGLPMHATCFRPVTRRALRKNPFRVFASVLRPELIKGTRA